MKARKRFSRVVASTLTLALLLGMLPMAAFAADPFIKFVQVDAVVVKAQLQSSRT